MAKKVSLEAAFLLQLGVALFLATLGIMGIAHWNSDLAQLGRGLSRLIGRPNDPTTLVVAIVELAAGIVVAGVLFLPAKGKLAYLLTLIIAILWVVYIVVDLIQNGFEPDALVRLNQLAANIVVLMGLWVVNRRYA